MVINRGGVRHLYLHVPFCRTRCAYCDFASEPLAPHQRAGRVDLYLTALLEELKRQESLLAPRLSTAYLGGGTPTALPAGALSSILARVSRLLAPGGELTVEANPGCLTEGLLELLQEAGCTRLSFGVQSFSPHLLRALGRRVNQPEIERALAAVARSGLEWSLDLVLGIPGQDADSLEQDLLQALAAGPPHISLYDLTYTPAYDSFLASQAPGGARRRAESFAEEAYAQAVDFLEQAGYRRYEVSNFALPGHESRHNLGYWRGEDYLGLGASAVSTVGGVRWSNPASVTAYLAGEPPERELLSSETRLFERAMLGLRTAEGVAELEVGGVLDREAWRRAEARNLAASRCGTLFLTQRGLDLSNALLAEVLVVPDGRAFPAGVR